MVISKSEQSYIKSSILASPAQRADGRSLDGYRPIALEVGGEVAPLANGSARVNIGGTEVIAAIKLEVEDIGFTGPAGDEQAFGKDGGRVSCNVSTYVQVRLCVFLSCFHRAFSSQSAYPQKSAVQLDELSADFNAIISSALSSSLTPSSQFTIVPNKKSWLLNIDALILSNAGNLFDAVFIAIRGALWDLRIPRTRGIEINSRDPDSLEGERDTMKELLNERKRVDAVDFELEDYWDDGDHLLNRNALPVAITLNLVRYSIMCFIFTPLICVGVVGPSCSFLRRIFTRRGKCTRSPCPIFFVPAVTNHWYFAWHSFNRSWRTSISKNCSPHRGM